MALPCLPFYVVDFVHMCIIYNRRRTRISHSQGACDEPGPCGQVPRSALYIDYQTTDMPLYVDIHYGPVSLCVIAGLTPNDTARSTVDPKSRCTSKPDTLRAGYKLELYRD